MGITKIAQTDTRQPGTNTGAGLRIAQPAKPGFKGQCSVWRDVYLKGIWLRFAHSQSVAYTLHNNNTDGVPPVRTQYKLIRLRGECPSGFSPGKGMRAGTWHEYLAAQYSRTRFLRARWMCEVYGGEVGCLTFRRSCTLSA
jgi:hypothetical protein